MTTSELGKGDTARDQCPRKDPREDTGPVQCPLFQVWRSSRGVRTRLQLFRAGARAAHTGLIARRADRRQGLLTRPPARQVAGPTAATAAVVERTRR